MIKNINKGINEFSLMAELTGRGKIYRRNYWYDNYILVSDVGYYMQYGEKYIFCTIISDNSYMVALPAETIPKLGKDIAYILFTYWKSKKRK